MLLDANVLVNAQVRDFFLRLADAELIDVCWSEAILLETERALTGRLGLEHAKVTRLLRALRQAFPLATIAVSDSQIRDLQLPDAGDRHVLAAAISGDCDLLVTQNTRDFPDRVLDAFDVAALTIDDALTFVAGQFSPHIGAVVDIQVAALRRPAMSHDDFFTRLARFAPIGAIAIGAAAGHEKYVRLFADIVDA